MAPKIGGAPPSVSVVQQRLQRSVNELLEADQKNPDQASNPSHVRANPWRAQGTGWNGAVDKHEAAGTSPQAQATHGAAAKAWGSKVVETAKGGGWVNRTYDKHEVTGQDLRRLQGLASSIVAELGGASGELSSDKLANLPQVVQNFWVKTFGQRDQLNPDQLDAIVNMIRTAAE